MHAICSFDWYCRCGEVGRILFDNTKVARELGFETITYSNYENMRVELAEKIKIEL